MSVFDLKELVPARLIPDSASAVYSVPASTKTIVKQILIGNTSSVDLTATVHFVPSGGSPTNDNAVFSDIYVSANNTLSIEIKSVLSESSSIHALASASASLNIHISGVEVS
jgi:hypothetical protein